MDLSKTDLKYTGADAEVTHECQLYSGRKGQWKIMRDCVEGADAVKAAGITYLPMASGRTTGAAVRRYEAFKKRAVYVNFVGQALDIMHGMIFRRQPSIKAPDEFITSAFLSNIDRRGNTLYQFLSDSVRDVMITGFGGLLLDMPPAAANLSVADAEKEGIRPYIRYYKAEDIEIWKTKENRGIERLAFIKLKERVDVSSSDFTTSFETRYRVLTFDENGHYIQIVFRPEMEKGGNIKSWNGEKKNIYVKGEQLDYIPFVMLPYGDPEKPMLYDLAKLNIAHYQSTADYKNGVHLSTLPTGWITGHEAERDENNPNKNEEITLGDDIFLELPEENARVGKLEFAGEGLIHAEKDIDKLEAQMAGLFVKDIAPDKKTSETAESAYVHRAGENARLATFARNVSENVSKILKMAMDWLNIKGDIILQLNYDYETMSLDPNIINSIANISGQGKFPLICVFWILQQQELIEPDMSLDDFLYLVEMENSSGLSPIEIYKSFRIKREGEHRQLKDVR